MRLRSLSGQRAEEGGFAMEIPIVANSKQFSRFNSYMSFSYSQAYKNVWLIDEYFANFSKSHFSDGINFWTQFIEVKSLHINIIPILN